MQSNLDPTTGMSRAEAFMMETVRYSCCAQKGPRNETQTHSHHGTRIKRNKVALQHPADIF